MVTCSQTSPVFWKKKSGNPILVSTLELHTLSQWHIWASDCTVSFDILSCNLSPRIVRRHLISDSLSLSHRDDVSDQCSQLLTAVGITTVCNWKSLTSDSWEKQYYGISLAVTGMHHSLRGALCQYLSYQRGWMYTRIVENFNVLDETVCILYCICLIQP